MCVWTFEIAFRFISVPIDGMKLNGGGAVTTLESANARESDWSGYIYRLEIL